MGLILKIVSEFYHLIIFNLALFILPIYCTFWIIGTACFSGLELWKMNLFSHYFINFSFTFLFIVTSIITMVSFIVIMVFVNAPGVVSICHVLFVLAFILTIVVAVVVASMSFICGSVTMVCSALLGFIMSMYIYLCMYVCVYIYICMFICVCVYVYVCVCVYIYIYPYFIVIVVFLGLYMQLLLSSL